MRDLESSPSSPSPRPGGRWRRFVLLLAGFLSLGLAAAGAVLPLLPTTPLVLVAAACFARSSPRLDAWLRSHSVFGPVIDEWREHGAIPRRVKWIATLAILLVGGSSVLLALPTLWLQVIVVSVLLGVVAWIWSFPDGPTDSARLRRSPAATDQG